MSPMCDWLVKHVVPESIAPNLITFIGFFINVFPVHIYLLIVYGLKLDFIAPSWVNYLFAGTLLFYNILDNIDGK